MRKEQQIHTHADTHAHTQPHLVTEPLKAKSVGREALQHEFFKSCQKTGAQRIWNLRLTLGHQTLYIISQPDTWRPWSLSQYWAIGLRKNMLTCFVLTKMGGWEHYVMQIMLRPRVTTGIRLVFWDRSSSCHSGLWTDWMAMASQKMSIKQLI